MTSRSLLMEVKTWPKNEASTYDRALTVDANYVPALYYKGVPWEKLGNHDVAQQLFDKAKELNPEYQGEFIPSAPIQSKALPSAL